MLGLAVLAVMASMAFLGTGTASANKVVLCKVKESPCTAANTYPAQEILDGKLKPEKVAKLTAGAFGNIVCTASTVEGQTKEEKSVQGSELMGQIQAVTWTGCTNESFGGAVCTAEALQLKWQARIAQENAGQESKFRVTEHSEPKNGTPAAVIKCPSLGTECTYGTTEAVLQWTGGNPAQIIANAVPLVEKVPKFVCPTNATWDAEYNATARNAPNALFAKHQVE